MSRIVRRRDYLGRQGSQSPKKKGGRKQKPEKELRRVCDVKETAARREKRVASGSWK